MSAPASKRRVDRLRRRQPADFDDQVHGAGCGMNVPVIQPRGPTPRLTACGAPRSLTLPPTRNPAMELRPLGSSGLKVSLIGLGCNNFGGRIDLDATRKVIDATLARRRQPSRHRRHLWRRRQVGGFHRPVPRRAAEGRRARDQIRQADGRQPGRPARHARPISCPRSRRASGGSAPTGSTSSTCTSPTRARRSRRRSAPRRS